MSEWIEYGPVPVEAPAPPREPTLKEEIRAHWDRKAPTFDQGETRVSRRPEVYKAWKKVFSGILGDRPRDLLDVGAGTGELVLLFDELGHRARGMDLSPEMVRVATEKAAARGVDTEFRIGDAEALPYNEGSFDAIHARHLLWTLPHPRRALADWLRVLRPGGILLVTEATWDGARPTLGDRLRKGVATLFAKIAGVKLPPPKSARSYPGPGKLPFWGGLGADGLRDFLTAEGLIDVRVVDLFWLRRMSRGSLPWYRRWMNPGKTGYYAAWGRRP